MATVDGESVPRAEFSHWLGIFTKEAAQTAQQQQGAAKPTAAQLRENTLRFLLSARWIDGEASDRGVTVSDADVKKSLDEQKKQGFPQAGDYEKYLKSSGQSNGDVLRRVRVSLLSNRLSTKVAGNGGTISDQAIADFYSKNQAKFVQPEKRDLRVVLTKDAAHARQARTALDAGQSWKSVTQRFSIDEQSKAAAGKVPAQAKGALDTQLDAAVFAAPKNEVSGPLKTQFGYFVFEVTGVTPGSTQTLAQAGPTIKQTLQSREQAEVAGSVRQGLQRALARADGVLGGLPHLRLQERPEADADNRRRRRPPVASPADGPEALRRLDELTRRLRRECPWDREQDERSIVPHTVEEAYELAAAAHADDDAKLLDELGDVLFQVHFLSLLMEERGAGSLAEVALHVHAKLVRRHPHIFGTVEVDSAGEVLRNWDAIKKTEEGREPGIFGEVPENLPGPLYARKVQRRAASTGFDFDHVPYDAVTGELEELESAADREQQFHEVGDVLFAAVNVARKLKVDPELALRAAADRFRDRVEGAEDLAAHHGEQWDSLSPEAQLQYYAKARLSTG